MTTGRKVTREIAERLLAGRAAAERAAGLNPRSPADDPLPPRIPAGNDHSPQGLDKRRAFLRRNGICIDALCAADAQHPATERAHIENRIGAVSIPVGVIGPLRINGSAAHGDFYVPLATTEGALVASYHRGAHVISQAGGAAVLCLNEAVSRAPCFCFSSMAEAAVFIQWALENFEQLKTAAAATTTHGVLNDMRTTMTGKNVYLVFDYYTGDAAGQNMVTIATDAVCRYIIEHCPVKPQRWFLEGNLSGDKKATMQSFMYARGRKVIAEAVIPARILKRNMHVSVDDMINYWHVSVLGGTLSGSIGAQGHYSNALAAVFAACGQDLACVSEASVGLTSMDKMPDGALYTSVVLPNLIAGTVGGGTGLPTARECLEMLQCYGDGGARKFAEICAATVLAGEISIIAALAAGHFAAAHSRYGRRLQQ